MNTGDSLSCTSHFKPVVLDIIKKNSSYSPVVLQIGLHNPTIPKVSEHCDLRAEELSKLTKKRPRLSVLNSKLALAILIDFRPTNQLHFLFDLTPHARSKRGNVADYTWHRTQLPISHVISIFFQRTMPHPVSRQIRHWTLMIPALRTILRRH